MLWFFLIIWLILAHRKARQVVVLIFKLRQRSFYNPKFPGHNSPLPKVITAPSRRIFLENQKIKMLWFFLIIWLILAHRKARQVAYPDFLKLGNFILYYTPFDKNLNLPLPILIKPLFSLKKKVKPYTKTHVLNCISKIVKHKI